MDFRGFSGVDGTFLHGSVVDVKRRKAGANSLYSKVNTLRYSRCVHSSFAEMFREALGPQRGAQAEFARKAKISYQQVNNLLNGWRPNIKKKGLLEKWADLLELTTDQKAEFILLGHLAHADPLIQQEFIRVFNWNERFRRESAELRQRIAQLEAGDGIQP